MLHLSPDRTPPPLLTGLLPGSTLALFPTVASAQPVEPWTREEAWPWYVALTFVLGMTVLLFSITLPRLRRAYHQDPKRERASVPGSAPPPRSARVRHPLPVHHGPQTSVSLSDREENQSAKTLVEHLAEVGEPGPPTPTDRLDTSIATMRCPRCKRLYDLGASFCPHDGTPLQEIEADPSLYEDHASAPKICPQCHEMRSGALAFCPEDGARLTPREKDIPVFAPVTVLFCVETQREVQPGTPRASDAPPLVPISGKRTVGLPATGQGPFRKVCPECGARYGLEMKFCAQDNHKLVNLN